MVRKQMCCDGRNSGGSKDPELNQPGGAAIPIAERMDPCDVHVGDHRLRHREKEILGMVVTIALEVVAIEPVAHRLYEELAVLSWSPAIHGPDDDALGAEFSGDHVILQLQA